MRLRPDARDRLLTILDMLTSGAATLSTTVILQVQVTRVSDALFAAVGSTDPLPALAGDQVQNLLMLPDAPRYYGDLAKALLLGMPRVLQARAEHAEMEAQAKAEADAENRKLTAQARAEAAGFAISVGSLGCAELFGACFIRPLNNGQPIPKLTINPARERHRMQSRCPLFGASQLSE